MKRTSIVFGLLCTFLVVVFAYGYSLPIEHSTTMQRHYAKSPYEIWLVIADYRKYSQWRENVYEVSEMPAKGGLEAWKEVDADGKSVPYAIASSTPGKQLIIEITDTTLPYKGTWTFDLLADESGTMVHITENGKIDNLFLRVITHFMSGYTQSMNSWLNSLENKFALESRALHSASRTAVSPASDSLVAPVAPPQAAAVPAKNTAVNKR